MPGITVGIDGSDHSRKALEWAVREAGLRHTSLTVLAVHQGASNHWTGNPGWCRGGLPGTGEVRQGGGGAGQKALGQVGGPAPASGTVRAVSGVAGQGVVKASAGAGLLVVGSRGGGGFARLA